MSTLLLLDFMKVDTKKASESLLSEQEYDKNIQLVREILNGKFKKVKDLLRLQMNIFSKKLHFWKSSKYKKKNRYSWNYQSKSTVVNQKLNNVDVFSIISDSENAYINYLQIAFGRVIRFQNLEIKKALDEDDIDILSLVIVSIRERFNSKSKLIIAPYNLSKQLNLKFIVPKAGDNKKLVGSIYKKL